MISSIANVEHVLSCFLILHVAEALRMLEFYVFKYAILKSRLYIIAFWPNNLKDSRLEFFAFLGKF